MGARQSALAYDYCFGHGLMQMHLRKMMPRHSPRTKPSVLQIIEQFEWLPQRPLNLRLGELHGLLADGSTVCPTSIE